MFSWNISLLLVLLRINLDLKLRHLLNLSFKPLERYFGYRFSDRKLDECPNLEDKNFL